MELIGHGGHGVWECDQLATEPKGGEPESIGHPGAEHGSPKDSVTGVGCAHAVDGNRRNADGSKGSELEAPPGIFCASHGSDTMPKGRLAPPRERTGVLDQVKVPLAALAAYATLTRSPRAHPTHLSERAWTPIATARRRVCQQPFSRNLTRKGFTQAPGVSYSCGPPRMISASVTLGT